jgi:hypothetical protein
MEDLDAKEDLSYQEYPVKILETSEGVTRNKKIKMSKVQWSHHIEEECDRTSSEMRGLSPKIISGDSR